jgi:hypothetical protein
MSSLSRHTRGLDQGRIDVQFHVQHVGSIQYTIVENVRFSLLTVQTFPRGEKHTHRRNVKHRLADQARSVTALEEALHRWKHRA